MNDFTKEELIFIWQKLAIANYENTGMHNLPNKVCSMIDNYNELETISVRGEKRLLSEFVNE